ncbi:MAG: DUF1653 domain-containing protein [Motiliproteus sp.]
MGSLHGEVQPGLYRHYKGGEYRVVGIARHSETDEKLVVYQPQYGQGGLWVRPLAMFLESVQTEHGAQPRFLRLTEID